MSVETLPLQYKGPVISLACSSQRGLLAVGQMSGAGDEPSLTIWDPLSRKLIDILETDAGTNIPAMAFDCRGESLLYSANGTLYKYELSGKARQELTTGNETIGYISASRTAPLAVISGKETMVIHTDTGKVIGKLDGRETWNEDSVLAHIAMSGDGKSFWIGGYEHEELLLLDTSSGKPLRRIAPAPSEVNCMSLGCQDRILAIAGRAPKGTFLYNAENGDRILPEIFNDRFGGYTCLSLHLEEEMLATGSSVGYVSNQELKEGKFLFSEQLHNGSVNVVIFAPDHRLLFSGGDDGNVHIIDIT